MMKRTAHSIERLEARIAPAALFTYTEVDGDVVTVKTSLGDSASLVSVATFDNDASPTKQLRRLSLDMLPAMFEATNLSVVVTLRGPHGDGLAFVGDISASGMDLGSVNVAGDLGQIDSGNSVRNGPAIKSLTVHSMGAVGLASQGGMGDLTSSFAGAVGKLTVKTNLTGVVIQTTSPGSAIGPTIIGGSLNTSRIQATGDIPSISIGQDVRGTGSGVRSSAGNIGVVKIGGDLVGDTTGFSGIVNADTGGIKTVTIGGSILGGDWQLSIGPSGGIFASGRIGAVTVLGDIATHPGVDSSEAPSVITGIRAGLNIGKVNVRGEIRGTLAEPVEIAAFDNPDPAIHIAIKSIVIGGSVADLLVGAGYALGIRPGGATGNADAQIGSITVGGDWFRSEVFAGISSPLAASGVGSDILLPGGQPGIISRIGAVVIKGAVLGHPTESAATAIIAEEVGSLSVNGAKLALNPLSGAKDRFVIGNSGTVRVYEV